MPANLIDGKRIAEKVKAEVADGVAALRAKTGIQVGLAVVILGQDPASHVYVKNKIAACAKAGVASFHIELPEMTTQAALLAQVQALNADPRVHGILVQLPLPKHIDPMVVIDSILPEKDVDGFSRVNVGALSIGAPVFVSCTPAGCMRLLDEIGFDPKGKSAIIIGRSNIVGKPMAMLLTSASATVTIAHSHTQNLPALVGQADLVVAALGKPKFVKGEWLKPGAVVLDVGVNRMPDGKLCGDVDFESATAQAGWITPVPGGVGVMTIAMLLANTLKAAQSAHKNK
jgi:methylenetetrahydrofolate dehydrogenase (NADP+) / methenyltetrahydrofolate cyclohydrolase